MTKKFGIVILSLLFALCLTSCKDEGKIKTQSVTREYETDYSTVKAEIISFVNLSDKEFEERLNNDISSDIESALVAFDTKSQGSAENLKMGNKCVFETQWQEKNNCNDFASLIEERYTYSGGAHGETVRLTRNIDTAANKEIKLHDLFEDSGYMEALNRMINEEVQKNAEEYSDLWEKPQIKDSNQKDFYIEKGKLVIYYQPYDLSYFARGFVEFRLSLEDLSGYLKEDYRRLITKKKDGA